MALFWVLGFTYGLGGHFLHFRVLWFRWPLFGFRVYLWFGWPFFGSEELTYILVDPFLCFKVYQHSVLCSKAYLRFRWPFFGFRVYLQFRWPFFGFEGLRLPFFGFRVYLRFRWPFLGFRVYLRFRWPLEEREAGSGKVRLLCFSNLYTSPCPMLDADLYTSLQISTHLPARCSNLYPDAQSRFPELNNISAARGGSHALENLKRFRNDFLPFPQV